MVVVGVLPGLTVIPHPNKVKTIVVIVVIMKMVVIPGMVDLQQKPKAALSGRCPGYAQIATRAEA